MHEVLLIYRSKYGSAKAYAEMAAERLGGLACTEQQATEQTLGQARCLALFGSLYAGGLSIAPFMKKHAALLGQKRAAVFAVGATPPGPDVLEAVRARLPKAGPRAYDTGGPYPLPDAAKIRGKKAGRHAGAVGAGAAGGRPGRRQLGRAPLPSAAALLSPIVMLEKQP